MHLVVVIGDRHAVKFRYSEMTKTEPNQLNERQPETRTVF